MDDINIMTLLKITFPKSVYHDITKPKMFHVMFSSYPGLIIVSLPLCVSAARLLCDPSADAALLVLPEDSLPAGSLFSRHGVFAGGRGHGGGRHSGRERPGIQ